MLPSAGGVVEAIEAMDASVERAGSCTVGLPPILNCEWWLDACVDVDDGLDMSKPSEGKDGRSSEEGVNCREGSLRAAGA